MYRHHQPHHRQTRPLHHPHATWRRHLSLNPRRHPQGHHRPIPGHRHPRRDEHKAAAYGPGCGSAREVRSARSVNDRCRRAAHGRRRCLTVVTNALCDMFGTVVPALTAVMALLAALASLIAASSSPRSGGSVPYTPADRNHPLWGTIEARARSGSRAARWSRIAAVFALLAALGVAVPWFLKLVCVK
jgi:hypothetical protein